MLNPYPLTEEQQDAYKKLFNEALELYGVNKNYSVGYYGSYKRDPRYLIMIKNLNNLPDHISKIKFEAMLNSFEKKGLIAYEYKEADFKIGNTIEKKEIVKINEIENLKEFKDYLYNGLISNENLTTKKRSEGENSLRNILKLYSLDSYFRVEIYGYKVVSPFICLREATQADCISDEEKKAKFKTMLQDLAQNNLITCEKYESIFGAINPYGTRGEQTLQVERIKEINLVELEAFYELTNNNRESLKEILNSSLKLYRLEEKYRIEDDGNYFRLRSSTQNPPSKNDQQNFQTIMSLLTEIGLIKSEANIITQLDRNIINSYKQAEGRVLYDKEYAKLDFNPLTWLYIDYCFKKNLARDNPDLDTGGLDSVYQDPISASTAMECPVVLPDSTGKIYDLKNILKLMASRSLDHKLVGANPLTRETFELSDIKPAPGGLKVLEKKIAAIQYPGQDMEEEAQVAAGPSFRR
jgi:hypothetical protein